MKFSHFMVFYTAVPLKCLDAVVYLRVVGVYSENEVVDRGTGTVFSTDDYMSVV